MGRRRARAGVIVGMIAGVLLTQLWIPVMSVFAKAGTTAAAMVPHLNDIELIVCVGVNVFLTVLISLLSRSPDR